MYRFSKALGSLTVRSTIQLCYRQPPSLSSSVAAASRWVTTVDQKSYGNLDQRGEHSESNRHHTSIVGHQIRLFSGQTARSKKKTQKRKKKKKVKKYSYQWFMQQEAQYEAQYRKEEMKRLKNLSHQAKLDEILSRCEKYFPGVESGQYFLDHDMRPELMEYKGWVRVQLVFSQSDFKHWCNADLFMEALLSHDGLDQYDVIYNRKVVETVELNKNRQYWQKLQRKQLKIKQVEELDDYLWKVRLELVKNDEKKYIDTELDKLKKERNRLTLTDLPVSTETSLSLTSMAARQRELEDERSMIDSPTFDIDVDCESDEEIAVQNKEFERCLDEIGEFIDDYGNFAGDFGERINHLSKKEKKDLRRLNCCARIGEELEELPSEIINDDRSSFDLKYALMRHQRVTKEYLDILRAFDENEDYNDLFH